jgi:hypothetical protein
MAQEGLSWPFILGVENWALHLALSLTTEMFTTLALHFK